MKYLFFIFPVILLSSCWELSKGSEKIEVTPGCWLYTVKSEWLRDIHTTICSTDKQEQTSYQESCGKGCTREVNIKTNHK